MRVSDSLEWHPLSSGTILSFYLCHHSRCGGRRHGQLRVNCNTPNAHCPLYSNMVERRHCLRRLRPRALLWTSCEGSHGFTQFSLSLWPGPYVMANFVVNGPQLGFQVVLRVLFQSLCYAPVKIQRIKKLIQTRQN